MPRIAAASIEEHIRNQTGRILDAASALFNEQGYRNTDMAGIARSMGLARNSLYRYYSSKDHILVAVIKRDMEPFVERSAVLKTQFKDPTKRLETWLALQVELAAGPCYTSMKMLGDMRDTPPELRKDIVALHEPADEVLQDTVGELLKGSRRDVETVSALIAGMVQSAGALAQQSKKSDGIVSELKKSVFRVLGK
jgi:AcrR family transcriptional regulator